MRFLFLPRCLTIFALSAAFACGCGGPAQPPGGTVSGTITYRGKPIMTGCFVTFVSDAGRAGSGTTDDSGKYTLQTPEGPNLPEGKYAVSVKPPGQPPQDPDEATRAAASGIVPKDPFPNFPKKYLNTETSGLSFEVKAGAQVFDFELKD